MNREPSSEASGVFEEKALDDPHQPAPRTNQEEGNPQELIVKILQPQNKRKLNVYRN